MKSKLQRLAAVATAASAGLLLSIFSAAPASGTAIVLHPDENICFFVPGDVPGVDVFFPAACIIVTSSSGRTTVVAKGELPEGFTLDATFVGTVPCFGQTGKIVATVSGQVTATCHL